MLNTTSPREAEQIRLELRDTVTTGLVLAALVAAFLFGIYRPQQRQLQAANLELNNTRRSISQLPQQVAFVAEMQAKVAENEQFLRDTVTLMPVEADIYRVVHDVAQLAQKLDLSVSRLEPMSVVEYRTFRVVPFRMNLSGRFANVVDLFNGLEQRDRLFTIQEFEMTRKGRQAGEDIDVAVNFSVYARVVEQTGSANSAGPAEKPVSAKPVNADKSNTPSAVRSFR